MTFVTDPAAERRAVMQAQYANAERLVNGVRTVVISALAIAAVQYAPHLTRALNLANLAVLLPMLTWAITQHFVFHRANRRQPQLSLINAFIDTTAISTLLFAYGTLGFPDLAVKSPIWAAYFLILAARPFTGSARWAALTAVVAATEYATVVLFFVRSGELALVSNPLATSYSTGTSVLDEGAKVLLILVGGVISTYATAWITRTLTATVDAMRASEARFRAVFEHSAVGIAMLDENARILDTNSAFQRFLGYDESELRGHAPHEFAPSAEAEAARVLMNDVSDATSASSAAEMRYLRRDGRMAWGSVTLSRADGSPNLRMIAMVQDISERKALEAKLVHQAFHDPLTGLANRNLFRDRVVHALQRSSRAHEEIAVMFLDLDNFKQVNDTLGHAAGDQLLSSVAARLLNATRGCDTVARLGGDEFAVLLENVRGDIDATIVAERIKQALRAPVEFDNGRTVSVCASMGIARPGPGDGSDELLRNADVAMYGAKGEARGAYVIFDPSMHERLVDRVSLELDMQKAIERGELSVAYQPIVSLETGTITGCEALMRWNHPVRGAVPPSLFIPIAEETGVIISLGRWVLREACARAAQWNAERPLRALTMTVNISAAQIADTALIDDVAEALRDTKLDPQLLVLEVTESVLMGDAEPAMACLNRLREVGVRLAIDDFGTGYSSLSQLQRFPVDVLKIDRSFTSGLPNDSNSAALAKTIIALGNMLTLRTVAEGVETSQQHERLRELGCGLGQGFLFSHPVAGDVLGRMLDSTITLDELVPVVGS
ncbi:MAG: EAL domain-containing protein [Gemmatimonadaceae bacterium]